MEEQEPVIVEGNVHMVMYSLDRHDPMLYFADVVMDDNEGTLEEVLQGYQGKRVRITIEEVDEEPK